MDPLTIEEAVAVLLHPAAPRAVHLCNAYTVVLAERDPSLTSCLGRSELNLPDGMPLVWIGKHLAVGSDIQRVSGTALMARCLDEGRHSGARHYLYGSTPEVLEALRQSIARRWPAAQIVGMESPPFRVSSDTELRDAVERMNECGATLVWVGLGTPKQDIEIDRLRQIGNATYVAVGAAFEFLAGTKRQAPAWIGRIGFEWLFRLATEPRRLWKRYLLGNAQFLVYVGARRNWRRQE